MRFSGILFLTALLATADLCAGDLFCRLGGSRANLSDRWQFEVSSPRFLAGLDGTVGLNGIDADVDVGFDQILDNLDMIFAGRVEARKGRLGIYGELIYLSLSDRHAGGCSPREQRQRGPGSLGSADCANDSGNEWGAADHASAKAALTFFSRPTRIEVPACLYRVPLIKAASPVPSRKPSSSLSNGTVWSR